MEKYKVGVIGGTGMVGQRFVTLMENHPWFQLTAIAASPRSAGKTYEEAVAHRWAMKTSIPEQAKSMVVLDAQADVDKIAQAGAFSEELETVDADTAFALYGLADAGLDREQLTDCAVLRSAGATCEEAAVLILDSEDDRPGWLYPEPDRHQQGLSPRRDPQAGERLDLRPGQHRPAGGGRGCECGHGCREELKLQEMPIPRFKNRGMLLF